MADEDLKAEETAVDKRNVLGHTQSLGETLLGNERLLANANASAPAQIMREELP